MPRYNSYLDQPIVLHRRRPEPWFKRPRHGKKVVIGRIGKRLCSFITSKAKTSLARTYATKITYSAAKVAVTVLLLIPSLALSADAKPSPKDWAFPPSPNAPQVTPAPSPDAVLELPVGYTYGVSFPEDCFLIASPPGLVVASQNAGPITLPGLWVGGTGKPEIKQFAGKAVFTVIGTGTRGRVELLVIRKGAEGVNDVARRLLDVGGGTPPTPGPAPDPTPGPDSPLSRAFRAAYQIDLSNGKAKPEYLTALEQVFRTATPVLSECKNLGEFQGRLAAVISTSGLIPAGSLPSLKVEIQKALKAGLPSDGNTPVTDALKAQCAILFSSMADALKGVLQ